MNLKDEIKLAEMMRLSSRIVKMLTDNVSTVTLSYSDMKKVMQIVDNAISQGVGNE